MVYDDFFFIKNNAAIRNISHWPQFFVNPGTISSVPHWGAIYRPLRTLSYAIDYALWEAKPFPSRCFNVLLHAFNALMVYALASRLVQDPLKSGLAALIFAVHPVQVEAVAWLSSRDNVLYPFFYLAALLCCFQRFGLSCLFFCIALLSKETAIVLPASMFLLGRAQGKTADFWKIAVMLALAVGYFLLRLSLLGQLNQQAYWGNSFATTAFSMAHGGLRYLELMIYPRRLSLIQDLPLVNSMDPIVLLAALGVCGAGIFSVAGARRWPIEAFCIAWIGLHLAPVSNIIPLTALIAERFLYLPIFGAALLLVQVTFKAVSSRKLAATLLLALASALALRTTLRNQDWSSAKTLWQSALQIYPDSARIRLNLAMALKDEGELSLAYQNLVKVIQANDNYALAHYQLGDMAQQRQAYQEAILHYQRALELEPSDSRIWCNLALCYERLHSSKALTTYLEYLEHHGEDTYVRFGLGNLLWKEGKAKEALEHLRRSVEEDPLHSPAWSNLGTLQLLLGSRTAAEQTWTRALEINPENRDAAHNLELLRAQP